MPVLNDPNFALPGTNPLAAPRTAVLPQVTGGGTTTGGGYTQPDWTSLLNTYLSPYQSIYDAQMSALQGRTDAQTQLANQRFSGSDTSTMSRLSDQHDQAVRGIINSLAGRGLINSGDYGFQQRRENLQYKRNQTDASNQLLDYLTGLQSSLADTRFQGLLGLQNQKMGLASTLGSLYQPTYTPPTSAPAGFAPAPSTAPSQAINWASTLGLGQGT